MAGVSERDAAANDANEHDMSSPLRGVGRRGYVNRSGGGHATRAREISTHKPRTTDRRYRSNRWKLLARAVLARDRYVCRVVAGCAVRASAADHIEPVVRDTPDALFFNPRNLRAACRVHNLARAQADKLKPNGDPKAVETGDYS